MLETHLRSPVTQERLRAGPAADHIDAFADWLNCKGYTPTTIDAHVGFKVNTASLMLLTDHR